MASYFREARNCELSTIKYIEDSFAADWTEVNVVKGYFQGDEEDIPVIAVRMLDTYTTRLEIGTDTLYNTHGFIIDIFARSDGQRLDFADYIMDKLKDGWAYYEHAHDSGNPELLTRTANGKVRVISFTENARVDFGLNVERIDRFRHILNFIVRKS